MKTVASTTKTICKLRSFNKISIIPKNFLPGILLMIFLATTGNFVSAQENTFTYYFDGDGDGYGKTNSPFTTTDPTPPAGYAKLGGDCNDGDATVNPGATEICGDGIDNNCDGQIDEGCSVSFTYYFDGDGDGYGKTNSPFTTTDPTPPAGYAKLDGDCNDGDATVHPGATEICGDGIDNNCDGQIDEGCSVSFTYYSDFDGDGYGKTNSPFTSPDPTPPAGYAKLDGDCNDGDATVHPGATEICGDGIDNNCDGQIDEGCSVSFTYYFDGDGDGYGKTNSPFTTTDPTPPAGYAKLGGDCNDGDATVHPGATEICGDGIDNNCDGQIDEGCSASFTYYSDFDGDGYGKTNSPFTTTDPTPPAGYAKLDGDCNDGDATVHPGATEICGDGIDNNCDGQIDEGCSVSFTYYFDGDGDGYGKTNSPFTSPDPTPPVGYAKLGGDCNDGDATVHPGATEICGDGIDNNCDGQIDEGCSVSFTYYFDGDGDGYGKTNSPFTTTDPTPPAGYAKLDGDCNDGDATVHPGATEICGDGIDNNCNGQIDEGCTVTTSYHLSTTSTGHGTIGTKITFTADAGYHIADIQIDGSSLGAITSYTFSNLAADHAVNAIFAVTTFTVTATAGTNGTISPAGTSVINYGSSVAYTITPKTGYHIALVTVDGSTVGAVDNYTFTNVIRNHTIRATFAINTYTIVSGAGDNGTITPNGSASVNYGSSKKYTISHNAGYHILDVMVDGVSVGAVKAYTFTGISANHSINASFASNTTNNSIVAAKQLNETGPGLSARPNPFRNDLTVMFTVAKKGKYDLTVTNISGRVLSKQKLSASAGSNTTDLNLAAYAAGSYFIILTGDSKTKTIKVIKAQ